jgi:hypothetical protein
MPKLTPILTVAVLSPAKLVALTGLTNNTLYYFAVTAVKDGVEGSQSAMVTATPSIGSPSLAPCNTVGAPEISQLPLASPTISPLGSTKKPCSDQR